MKGKKTLKVYYARVQNMGDILNSIIIEKLFGFKVSHHTYLTGELSAIGSGLGQFTLHGNVFFKTVQKIAGWIFPNVTIWGTGFICNQDKDSKFYRRNIKFSAVRGQLSKERIERILGYAINIPLGDAGILSSYLLKGNIQKKYKIGVIAHFKEQNEPIFKTLLEHFESSTFIDVKQHPEVVISQIAECECIISSSLHGLIIADSLYIPNIHIIVSDKLLGDGFKFEDYYSAYGIKHPYIIISENNIPTIDWIKDKYLLTPTMIDKMKRDMIKSFPLKNDHAPIFLMFN